VYLPIFRNMWNRYNFTLTFVNKYEFYIKTKSRRKLTVAHTHFNMMSVVPQMDPHDNSIFFIIAEVKVSNIGRVDRPVFYWKVRLNLNEFYLIWSIFQICSYNKEICLVALAQPSLPHSSYCIFFNRKIKYVKKEKENDFILSLPAFLLVLFAPFS
jgi:hypothetical protein